MELRLTATYKDSSVTVTNKIPISEANGRVNRRKMEKRKRGSVDILIKKVGSLGDVLDYLYLRLKRKLV